MVMVAVVVRRTERRLSRASPRETTLYAILREGDFRDGLSSREDASARCYALSSGTDAKCLAEGTIAHASTYG